MVVISICQWYLKNNRNNMYQIYNESVNAMSNAINYKTRPLRQEETFLLREFLYEAIFIPKE